MIVIENCKNCPFAYCDITYGQGHCNINKDYLHGVNVRLALFDNGPLPDHCPLRDKNINVAVPLQLMHKRKA